MATTTHEQVIHPSFCTSPLFQRGQEAFWITFLLFPLLTGYLSYDWLPDESFDESHHELLDFEDIEDGNGKVHERPLTWKHKENGAIFHQKDFADHRLFEAGRIASLTFFYGLSGCFFFAWTRYLRNPNRFCEAFGKAALVNLAFAAYIWISTIL